MSAIEDLTDATVEPLSAASRPSADRERLIAELCPDGEAAMEAAITNVLEQDDLDFAGVGCLALALGAANGCPVPRLVRVRLSDGTDSRLAEPVASAVVEAGLSLLRAKGP